MRSGTFPIWIRPRCLTFSPAYSRYRPLLSFRNQLLFDLQPLVLCPPTILFSFDTNFNNSHSKVRCLWSIGPANGNMASNKMFWWLAFAFLLHGPPRSAESAHILAMLPIAARSHWNVLDAVLQTFVARGHSVTAVTPFLKDGPVANYTEVDISQLTPSGVSIPWDFVMEESSVANNLPYLSGRHRLTCTKVFKHAEFWRVLQSTKYVCIVDVSNHIYYHFLFSRQTTIILDLLESHVRSGYEWKIVTLLWKLLWIYESKGRKYIFI